MSEAPLKATLKAGRDYDAPWVTVDGHDPDDLAFKLKGLADSGALEAVVNAANLLKGVNNAAPIAAEVTPPPQEAPQQQWGQQQTQAPAPTWATGTNTPQQAAPQQQQRPAGNHPAAQLHPEGTQCELPGCSNVLEFKKTQTGKAKWQCPEWRWNNGSPNGHGMEWAN